MKCYQFIPISGVSGEANAEKLSCDYKITFFTKGD